MGTNMRAMGPQRKRSSQAGYKGPNFEKWADLECSYSIWTDLEDYYHNYFDPLIRV